MWFASIFPVYVLSDHSKSAPRDGGVVRLHVKEGYFFTPPKRVTLPTWGPSPPGTQALRSVMVWHHLHFEWQANARVSDEAVFGGGKEEFSFSFLAPCTGVPLARDYPHD